MSDNSLENRMLNLQLFAEGIAAGDGGTKASGQTAGGVFAAPQADANSTAIKDNDSKSISTTPDSFAEFEELIKGKHKDAYEAKVKAAVSKRLKGTNETVAKFNELAPAIDTLAKKYGVDPSDIKAIVTAIEEDDSLLEDEALERGMTVDQLRPIKKMEREVEISRKREAERIAHEKYTALINEAEATKKVYPSFDLDTAMQNDEFVQMLKIGIPIKHAYEVLNWDKIMPTAMQYASQKASQQVTNSVIANGARPTENGVNAQASAVVKPNVSQLTRTQRAAAIAAAQRGERISYS